jgi:hypothetical protein
MGGHDCGTGMNQDIYDVLVGAHVACAILGFGSVALSGVYGFGARKLERQDRVEESRRYFRSPGRLEVLLVAVPFLGAAALVVEPRGAGVAQLWAGLAAVVWAGATVILLRVVRPSEGAIREALAGGDFTEAAAAGARLGRASVMTDVAFAVALGLMVFQPHA